MDHSFLLAFGTYLGILGCITYWFHAKNKNNTDLILGNRSLNYIATAIAAHSSDMSIWLFMGFPGMVYLQGMSQIWMVLGLIAGMYCSWTFIAGRLRAATEHYESKTLSQYFEKRFNDSSGSLRLVSALLSLLFFIFYISSGLVGMGIMFESVFGINYHIGVLCGLLTAVAYTFIGGFVGVAWCDLFQGAFLVSMIVMVPILGYSLLQNGWTDISNAAQLKNISLNLLPNSFEQLFHSLLLALAWGIGYFGQPHILINFMGIKDAKETTKAKHVGMTWQFLTLGASLLVGLIGIALFPTMLANPELIFVVMVQKIFTPFFAGFVLCAIIAAGLTTVDTQILVAASVISEDIYKQFFNRKATQQQLNTILRFGIIIVPLISYMVAFNRSNSVFGLVDFAWMGLGSTFGPVVLTSLYSKHITKHAVLSGMIVGGLIAALWQFTGSNIPAMIPGFFSNLCVILLGSQLQMLGKKTA